MLYFVCPGMFLCGRTNGAVKPKYMTERPLPPFQFFLRPILELLRDGMTSPPLEYACYERKMVL